MMLKKNFIKIVEDSKNKIWLRTSFYKYLLDVKVSMIAFIGALIGIFVIDALVYYGLQKDFIYYAVMIILTLQFLVTLILMLVKPRDTVVINFEYKLVEHLQKSFLKRTRTIYNFCDIEKVGLIDKQYHSYLLNYTEYIFTVITKGKENPLISFSDENLAESIVTRTAEYLSS